MTNSDQPRKPQSAPIPRDPVTGAEQKTMVRRSTGRGKQRTKLVKRPGIYDRVLTDDEILRAIDDGKTVPEWQRQKAIASITARPLTLEESNDIAIGPDVTHRQAGVALMYRNGERVLVSEPEPGDVPMTPEQTLQARNEGLDVPPMQIHAAQNAMDINQQATIEAGEAIHQSGVNPLLDDRPSEPAGIETPTTTRAFAKGGVVKLPPGGVFLCGGRSGTLPTAEPTEAPAEPLQVEFNPTADLCADLADAVRDIAVWNEQASRLPRPSGVIHAEGQRGCAIAAACELIGFKPGDIPITEHGDSFEPLHYQELIAEVTRLRKTTSELAGKNEQQRSQLKRCRSVVAGIGLAFEGFKQDYATREEMTRVILLADAIREAERATSFRFAFLNNSFYDATFGTPHKASAEQEEATVVVGAAATGKTEQHAVFVDEDVDGGAEMARQFQIQRLLRQQRLAGAEVAAEIWRMAWTRGSHRNKTEAMSPEQVRKLWEDKMDAKLGEGLAEQPVPKSVECLDAEAARDAWHTEQRKLLMKAGEDAAVYLWQQAYMRGNAVAAPEPATIEDVKKIWRDWVATLLPKTDAHSAAGSADSSGSCASSEDAESVS